MKTRQSLCNCTNNLYKHGIAAKIETHIFRSKDLEAFLQKFYFHPRVEMASHEEESVSSNSDDDTNSQKRHNQQAAAENSDSDDSVVALSNVFQYWCLRLTLNLNPKT